MPHIDSTKFGSVTIDGKIYKQVLVIGDFVEERNEARLDELFGTTHRIGDWEVEKLLGNKPEIVVVGTGQNGVLEVTDDVRKKLSEVELIELETPKAIEKYNKLFEGGRKVNALIHTTC
ncbi:MAG: hypothetical protein ACD_63C00067G0006 [uncultured bacterium]|nr:MAG: hypothetical protein ACD_63C00067G0006 [uncultured bacterium]